MIKSIFTPAKNSASANIALLVLRLWIGLEMLLVHGIGKLADFKATAPNFPDPLGIGHMASLALTVFAEVFASALIILGLFTRLGALLLIIEMAVAFLCVHKRMLIGEHNGELAFLYLLAYVVLFLAGPGRISADKAFFGKTSAGSAR
jgi:putative oxidoreductase